MEAQRHHGVLRGAIKELRLDFRDDREGDDRLRDQLFLRILLGVHIGFADRNRFAGAQHPGAAAQTIAYRGPQQVDLELNAEDVLMQADSAAGGASCGVVRHRSHDTGVDATMLLPVHIAQGKVSFAPAVFDCRQFETQMADEIGIIEDMPDFGCNAGFHRPLTRPAEQGGSGSEARAHGRQEHEIALFQLAAFARRIYG